MTERIIDLSADAARLRIKIERLIVSREGQEDVAVPLDEVAVLIVAHREVVYTQAVLAEIAAHGGVFIACNGRSMPVGMMLPIEQHHLQAERFQHQARAAEPTKKRIWQQIVRAKVRAQARLLRELHDDDHGLGALSGKVLSGDAKNVEAQAARRYWGALFGDPAFRRYRDGPDQNRLLNYGYAVLRAQVSRAVCAAGLHPSLGVHHHNRYDAFCLSDDLMEPFRPIVDRAVVAVVATHGEEAPMDRPVKGLLIGALTGRFVLDNESRTLFDILTRTASSLAKIFMGEVKRLALPEI